MHRRQYLAAVVGTASTALAGCSGDSSGSGSEPTTDSCTEDRSQNFCQSEEFVSRVKQHVASTEIERTEPPELFGGGVVKEDGEPSPREVRVEMVSDAPNQLSRTGEVTDGDSLPEPTRVNMGYVVDGFAEYIDEYPHIISMVVSVYQSVDRETYYGKFTILGSYATKYNNDERSSRWYLNTVLLTWAPAETATSEETATPEEIPVFVDYGIDGSELSVELTQDALSQVAQIRLETPTGEKTTEVAQTITEYSLDILRARAGTWLIDALDSSGEIIETVEFETTFDVSVDGIGTLAQLGVTGKSPEVEDANIQLTITNTGDVPVEPVAIQTVVPDLDYSDSGGTIGRRGEMRLYDEGTKGGLLDRDGEFVIPADSDNTYKSDFGDGTSTPLVFFEDRANEIAGQSFQGEIVIGYQAEREDTVVPITIEMGDEVVTLDEDFENAFLRGTTINKR